MESFVIGVFTVVFTYVMAMSYTSTETKRTVNKYTGTPLTDIILTIGVLILIGSNGLGIMLTALGIGVGLSLCFKASTVWYGRKK